MKTALLLACAACAAAQIRLPEYRREVLPNGVVLCLAPRHDLPLVDLRVIVKGGSEADPNGLAGLGALTADLLDEGTATRSSAQFAGDLDGIGATLSTSTDAQASTVAMSCLARHAGRAVELLADAVLHPALAQTEFRKAVARDIDGTRAMKDSPGTAAWEYFAAFFFGRRHPYGRPSWGDEISLRRITLAHVRDYHQRMYVGSNLVVVAAGDFDPEDMRAGLGRAFGGVRAGVPYRWRADQPLARRHGSRLLLVDKPDATQANLLIGLPGISRTHPDRVPLWLVDTVFGGSFSSMLNGALRVERGLAYGASSWMDQNRLTGAIVLSTATPTGSTRQAADLTLGVLQRFHREGITADQLAAVKRYLKGTWPAENMQTTEQVAALIGELELNGLDRDEIDGLFGRIDAVTLEQANAVVRKYFTPEDLYFVVVGNAARIRAALTGYAPKLVQVSIAQPGFEPLASLHHARR